MRKKSLIIIILLLIVFSVIIFRHKSYGHSTIYTLKEDNLEFKIKEVLVKDEGYYLYIKRDDKEYIFHYDDLLNGEKKILKNIKYYKNGNIECLYPIYKDDSNNNDILCNKSDRLYSYISIKETNKSLEIFSDLNLELFKNSNSFKNYNRLNIYQGNIPNNTYLTIWNYKGIDLITKESVSSINYLDQDQYDNTHGIMIDNLYITPDYNQKYDFTKFIIIDVKTKKKREYKIDKKISFDSYINGIIDNKLYLFDRDNLIQYEFDFQKNKYKIIGNKDLNGKYYSGEWKEINIYDLLNKEIHFSKKVDLKEDYQIILESKNSYYLYYKNGEMYRVYKNDLKRRILLFTKKNIKDFKISNDFIFFRDNTDIYMYNDNYGLRKVLENSEFNYNSNNIYQVFHE